MSGVSPSILVKYPVELTDKDWQAKKGKVAKLVKTGIKAELDKAEKMHKGIDVAALTTEQASPKTFAELEKAKLSVAKYYKEVIQPFAAQLKTLSDVADKADKKLAKLKMSDAAKAAGIISKKADQLAITCKSIDLAAEIAISEKRIKGLYEKAEKELKPSIAKFLKSVAQFIKSGHTNQEWQDLVKQNGRSVSNSVKQLDAYNKEFWTELKAYQGFDTSTMKLSTDSEEHKALRKKLAEKAQDLVERIAAFDPK